MLALREFALYSISELFHRRQTPMQVFVLADSGLALLPQELLRIRALAQKPARDTGPSFGICIRTSLEEGGIAARAPNQAERDFDVGQRELLELLKRLELLDDDISAVRTDSERARACRVSDAARSNEAREGELA